MIFILTMGKRLSCVWIEFTMQEFDEFYQNSGQNRPSIAARISSFKKQLPFCLCCNPLDMTFTNVMGVTRRMQSRACSLMLSISGSFSNRAWIAIGRSMMIDARNAMSGVIFRSEIEFFNSDIMPH